MRGLLLGARTVYQEQCRERVAPPRPRLVKPKAALVGLLNSSSTPFASFLEGVAVC
jgi:hypothetical protein